MQGTKQIDKIFAEIDELYNVVNFGSHRIDDFAEQVDFLESSFMGVSSRAQLDKFMTRCQAVRQVIQATGESIRAWKITADEYLDFITCFSKNQLPDAVAHLPLDATKEKSHRLIVLLKQQHNSIVALQEQLSHLDRAMHEKRQNFKYRIRRGRDPQLVSAREEALA